MKIWEKDIPVDSLVEDFTIGNDPVYDLELAPYDVLGSMAHIHMLTKIGLVDQEELSDLLTALKEIYGKTLEGNFKIEKGMEDVHSQVEWILTQKLGDSGKKIHAGRSRNDQVLVDLRLMFRDRIKQMHDLQNDLFHLLIELAKQNQQVLIPGYTHLQAAMPSSFGLWFSAFAENIVDDLKVWKAAFDMINQNPLGSGAGYGTSLPLDRSLTTRLLGFADLSYNVINAQMGRGRSELFLSFAMSATANTLSKMAMDVCLYNSQNFGFIKLDDSFTTGSSIMPHKKNPDVFELIRAKCNVIGQLPGVISGAFGFLPSGYHRDFQLLKEQIFPAVTQLENCLRLSIAALKNIIVNDKEIKDEKYDLIFSVESVNELVNNGVPFREAYQQVAKSIQEGNFVPNYDLKHTHEGSLGNLCLDEISAKMENTSSTFDFSYQDKIQELLRSDHR